MATITFLVLLNVLFSHALGMSSDKENLLERSEFCSKDIPVDACKLPKLSLDERFGSCGSYVEKSATAEKPSRVVFQDVDMEANYVLVMVDPDVASRTSNDLLTQLWRHWVVGNIKGKDLHEGSIQGNILTSYNGPAPPLGKKHRYNFYLFKQPTANINGGGGASRGNFNLRAFIDENNLCSPEAGFQFKTETL